MLSYYLCITAQLAAIECDCSCFGRHLVLLRKLRRNAETMSQSVILFLRVVDYVYCRDPAYLLDHFRVLIDRRFSPCAVLTFSPRGFA